jgi:hypothetical protein
VDDRRDFPSPNSKQRIGKSHFQRLRGDSIRSSRHEQRRGMRRRCFDLGKKGPAQLERWFRAQVVAEMTPKKIT